jgi:hypothetical protein
MFFPVLPAGGSSDRLGGLLRAGVVVVAAATAVLLGARRDLYRRCLRDLHSDTNVAVELVRRTREGMRMTDAVVAPCPAPCAARTQSRRSRPRGTSTALARPARVAAGCVRCAVTPIVMMSTLPRSRPCLPGTGSLAKAAMDIYVRTNPYVQVVGLRRTRPMRVSLVVS